jgi:pimeloyl-ACP methyl ester carboxylesterase
MKLSQRVALSYIRTKLQLLSAVSKKKAAREAFRLFCTPQLKKAKPLPAVFAEAERLNLQFEELMLAGWRWNQSSGKKLLILHGFESSVINFEKYIKPAIRKGYEVLAFDAPAHGRSSGQIINAPLYKRMILAIDQAYGPINAYIAHSFGGLALVLALEEMHDVRSVRAVLVAPATETTTAIDKFFSFMRLDPSLRPEFDSVITKGGGVNPEWYSVGRAIKKINARILWVHDEDDDTTPIGDVLPVKAENYPHIDFLFTKGLGHRRIYRDNRVRNSIIDFL